jgi:hypothetical protein
MNALLEQCTYWKVRFERVARRIWHPAPTMVRREIQMEFPWVLKK